MQVAVNDIVYGEAVDDPVLESLLVMTLKEINEGRPLFPNPMDEPLLYGRYFKRWVREAVKKLQKFNEEQNK
jgi:hypothetical protein